MRVDVTFRNIPAEEHASARELLESLGGRRVAKALGRLAGKAPRLHATLERHPSGERVRVRLRVAVPGNMLVSHEVRSTLAEAIHEAAYELARQARRYAARVEHRRARGREGRQPPLRRVRAALGTPGSTGEGEGAGERGPRPGHALLEAAGDDLVALRRFVRHELTYLRATGELAPDLPTLDDVLDEVITHALDELRTRQGAPPDGSARAWLLGLAVRTLDRERELARQQRTRLSLDERVVPPAGVLVDDEMMDFWQPDEVLRVEDLIPADWAPEETWAGGEVGETDEPLSPREAALMAHQLLTQVPHTWRRALTLRDVYELTGEEAAAMLTAAPDAVARWSDAAASFLDERARGLGLELGGRDGVRALLGAGRGPSGNDVEWDATLRAVLG